MNTLYSVNALVDKFWESAININYCLNEIPA